MSNEPRKRIGGAYQDEKGTIRVLDEKGSIMWSCSPTRRGELAGYSTYTVSAIDELGFISIYDESGWIANGGGSGITREERDRRKGILPPEKHDDHGLGLILLMLGITGAAIYNNFSYVVLYIGFCFGLLLFAAIITLIIQSLWGKIFNKINE